MPLDAWANINPDARLIGMAAALRTFQDHGNFEIEVIRNHVDALVEDDVSLIGPAMAVAQWISLTQFVENVDNGVPVDLHLPTITLAVMTAMGRKRSLAGKLAIGRETKLSSNGDPADSLNSNK